MPVYDCGDPNCTQCKLAFRTAPTPPTAPAESGERSRNLTERELADLAEECAAARGDRQDEIAQHAIENTGERPEDWPLEIEVPVYQLESLLSTARANAELAEALVSARATILEAKRDHPAWWAKVDQRALIKADGALAALQPKKDA